MQVTICHCTLVSQENLEPWTRDLPASASTDCDFLPSLNGKLDISENWLRSSPVLKLDIPPHIALDFTYE